MREKLNSNPLAQVAVVGVLLVVVGVYMISSMGGGGGSSSTTTSTTSTGSTPAGTASVAATLTTPSAAPTSTPAIASVPPGVASSAAPPLPHAVTAAWSNEKTVVLLFVRHGGIDDRMVAAAVDRLGNLPDVAAFVVPADRIARYAAIAQGVDLNRVPALVVLRPKRLDRGIPSASVSYGFQTPQSVVQAVIDADYRGRTVPYHP